MHHSEIKSDVRKLIAEGTVIPAHPLALDAKRTLDVKHQRALTRYYIDAGAGGLAVGVHTTQFAIRDVGMYKPVLELAAETAAAWTKRPLAMVAGLAGPTPPARSIASHSIPAMTTTSCSTLPCRSTCGTRVSPQGRIFAAGCSGTGRYGRRPRSSSSKPARPPATRTRCRQTFWRSMPASPTATAPSSTSPTIFTAASQGATR